MYIYRYVKINKKRKNVIESSTVPLTDPEFDMAYKTIQYVSVSNLKLFGSMERKLWGKEVEKFSIMLYR